MNHAFLEKGSKEDLTSTSINYPSLSSRQIQCLEAVNHDSDPLAKCDYQKAVLLLNGVNKSHDNMPQDYYLDPVPATLRKKGSSTCVNSEQGELVRNLRKENIKVEIQDGDTLISLALKYNCAVSEIKSANRIYTDQDFHALSTVLIPVLPFSQLSSAAVVSSSFRTSPKRTQTIEEMNRGIVEQLPVHERFRPERPHLIRDGFTSLSDEEFESGASDCDDSLCRESDVLLNPSSSDRDVVCGPVDVSGKSAEQLLNQIQKRVEDVERLSRTWDPQETSNSLSDVKMVHPGVDPRKKGDALGVLCGCSWRLWLTCGLMVVAGIPFLLYLAFKYFPDQFPKF